MAYLHCHSCDWGQDDFYHSTGYNPADYLKTWNKYLFKDNINEQFSNDSLFVKQNGPISTREVIAKEYEKFANSIREMKWITYEQWINEPNKICPKCGSKDLDID